jgi:membrane protein YdbS with pleckstrin-like domain
MMKNTENNNHNYSGDIGFTGLLTLIFIVLKLIGVINWSWWWVLSPLWISFGIGIIVVAVVLWVVVVAINKNEINTEYSDNDD